MGNDPMEKRTNQMYEQFCKQYPEPKDEAGKRKQVFKKIGKVGSTKFTICHSAKDVTYDCKAFIERDADSMSKSLIKIMETKCTKTIS